MNVTEVVPDKKTLGKQFKKDSQVIIEQLKRMTECDIEEMEKSLNDKGYDCQTICFCCYWHFGAGHFP